MVMFFNGWLGYGTNVTAGVLAEPADSGYVRRPFVLGSLDSGIVSDIGSGCSTLRSVATYYCG